MADNTTLNSGSGGDTLSTDDIGGGVKVQRVKIQTGVDGTATDVSTSNLLPSLANAAAIIQDKAYTTDTNNPLTQMKDGRLRIADHHTALSADTTNVNTNYGSAQTNASLVSAPGASKRLVVVEITFSTDTAGNVKLIEDTAGTPATKWGPHYLTANGGISISKVYIPLSTNKNLGITTTIAGNHTITLRAITENV